MKKIIERALRVIEEEIIPETNINPNDEENKGQTASFDLNNEQIDIKQKTNCPTELRVQYSLKTQGTNE